MAGVAILSFSAIMVKESNFEPATSTLLRGSIALIVLLPFCLLEIHRKGRLNARGALIALGAGVFLGIDFIAWSYSAYLVGAGVSSVLLNLQIIILPVLAMIFDKYPVQRRFWVLVPIMLVGIVLTGGVFEATAPDEISHAYGIPIAVLGTVLGSTSGVCYGLYLYASRKSGRLNPGRYIQPLVLVCGAQAGVAAIFMVFSQRGLDLTHGVLNADGTLPPQPIADFGAPIGGYEWAIMVVLAITAQALVWTLIQYGSVHLDPTITAGLLLLSPIFTVFTAAALLDEIPSLPQVIGVIIVLGAVAVQNNLHRPLLPRFRDAKPERADVS